jgi:mersacidin/lichenicidin family type 2 lantibiotic
MKLDIVRAWKDPLYRSGLDSRDIDLLPSNPAGVVELRF